jgi:YD repeat-containing protein
LDSITDAEGYVTRTIYDAFGRVQQRIQDEGGLNLTATYTYDLNNNLETVTDERGIVTEFNYDDLNRVESSCGDTNGLNLCTTYCAIQLSRSQVHELWKTGI